MFATSKYIRMVWIMLLLGEGEVGDGTLQIIPCFVMFILNRKSALLHTLISAHPDLRFG